MSTTSSGVAACRALPEGLAELAPGPGLAAVLATVDRDRLSGADVLEVAAAQARQVAHEQARLLADVLRAGYTAPGPTGQPAHAPGRLDEFCAEETAFTLHWSRGYAHAQVLLARDLIERLPVVYAALAAGRICYARAVVFSDALLLLDDDTAQTIAAKLIGPAQRLTPGELRRRLRYQVIKADPGQARARYQRGVADRAVWTGQNEDGTASLAGINLPPDRAAAANQRLDALARAARHAGDVRTLNQLRADAMLDLIRGVPFHLHPHTDPLTDAADAAAREEEHSHQPTTTDAATSDAATTDAATGPDATGGDTATSGAAQPSSPANPEGAAQPSGATQPGGARMWDDDACGQLWADGPDPDADWWAPAEEPIGAATFDTDLCDIDGSIGDPPDRPPTPGRNRPDRPSGDRPGGHRPGGDRPGGDGPGEDPRGAHRVGSGRPAMRVRRGAPGPASRRGRPAGQPVHPDVPR